MFQITKSPDPISLARNAVLFEIQTDSPDPFDVSVSVGGNETRLTQYPALSGGLYFATVDVSDVLRAAFPDSPAIPMGDAPIYPMAEFFIEYSVAINETSYNFKAVNGGISNAMARALGTVDTDIFDFRLTNSEALFLFTTRTNERHLRIHLSEMFPFIFLHPGKTIVFRSEAGNTRTYAAPAGSVGNPYVVNFLLLRNEFFIAFGEVANFLTVMVDGKIAFDVTFLPDPVVEDKYRLRFLNSLGAYEQVVVTGTARLLPEFEEQDAYRSLNESFWFYEKKRDRVRSTDVISVEAGYKSKADLMFLLDMIASDVCLFVYPDGSVCPCLVSAASPEVPLRVTTPQSMLLKVTFNATENLYSPPIDRSAFPLAWILDDGKWRPGGVWTDTGKWNP